MASKRENNRRLLHEGYQPNLPESNELGGYQPQANLPPNLKPPKGGTAIEPPQKPTDKPSERKE